MTVNKWQGEEFELSADVLVVGAGATGLCAALAAADAGCEVLVLEQTKTPLGTTAMSTGLIPAAGTPEQAAEGIEDSPELLTTDIMKKAGGRTDKAVVRALAETSAETVAWLRERHGIPLSLVDGFLYPGHSVRRMYGTPNRTGSELMAALEAAATASGVDIYTEARASELFVDSDNRVRGVRITRPDGSTEEIGCRMLILASCGFAGNEALIERYIPELANAVRHTHPANQGQAILWGEALGAEMADLDSYQGHGGLAAGHGVPILWPSIMQGGFQVNRYGQRFSNEASGYSEQARHVLAQPGSVAWTVFDNAIFDVMNQFSDFKDALDAQAVAQADDIRTLAATVGIDADGLEATVAEVERFKSQGATDAFGRDFAGLPGFQPPYYAVRVTGAIFHTQGGLCVDEKGRVKRQDGSLFPNLYAGGGAARGVSGPGADGYIAGNGLLTATSLGKLAGRDAARQLERDTAADRGAGAYPIVG